MNPLLKNSYGLILQDNGTDYKFETADGVRYNAVFGTAEEFFPGTAFANDVRLFAIRPEKGHKPTPGIDPRIGITLAKIGYLFFQENPNGVFFYICETNDKKELARLRKFDKTFDEFNNEEIFIKTNFSDKPTGSHGATICRADHPNATQIRIATSDIPALFA